MYESDDDEDKLDDEDELNDEDDDDIDILKD